MDARDWNGGGHRDLCRALALSLRLMLSALCRRLPVALNCAFLKERAMRSALLMCSASVVTLLATPAFAQLVQGGNGLPTPGIEMGGDKYVDPKTAEKRREI